MTTHSMETSIHFNEIDKNNSHVQLVQREKQLNDLRSVREAICKKESAFAWNIFSSICFINLNFSERSANENKNKSTI